MLDRPEATPQRLQAGHLSLVKARLQMPGTYRLLEDTTEPGWTRVHPVEDLASIGNLQSNQCRGFRLHTTLAVRRLFDAEDDKPTAGRPAVEMLGIADQEYVLKKPRPPGEKPGDVRASQKRADRLSMVWLRSGQRLGDAPKDAEVRRVRVADREADLYEYLCDCRARGHGFVVRAAYERVLLDTQTEQRNGQYLLSFARTLPAMGEFTLPLRARTGVAARLAHLSLSAAPVRILAPDRPCPARTRTVCLRMVVRWCACGKPTRLRASRNRWTGSFLLTCQSLTLCRRASVRGGTPRAGSLRSSTKL